ncbi:MAG: hypothetical protein JST76_07730 [Bacteroidetes bacterium]|nr:hypothetical protein [Bacteroidota bacterium]
MKKFSILILSIALTAAMFSSCAKTKTDPFDPFVGDFKGTLSDSDIVTHQVVTRSGYPVNINKLTSTRIGLGSDSAGLTDFYADVTISGADMSGSIPGQTADTTTIQGIAVSSLGLPSGTTLAYTGATNELVFGYRLGYTTATGGRVLVFRGTKQ